jgi:hypothetical protein
MLVRGSRQCENTEDGVLVACRGDHLPCECEAAFVVERFLAGEAAAGDHRHQADVPRRAGQPAAAPDRPR